MEFGSVTVLESSQVLGQPGVKSVCDHGHDHIEVDFDKDGEEMAIAKIGVDRI
jgi:hypothetical protein